MTATLVTWPRAARVVYNRQLERICALGRFPTSTAAIAATHLLVVPVIAMKNDGPSYPLAIPLS